MKRPKTEEVPPAKPLESRDKANQKSSNEKDVVATSKPTFGPPIDPKKQYRTTRASSQFRSPLSASGTSSVSSVKLTPTIQALECKVQTLRRAVKVKQGGEEEVLEGLVKKWTEAAREVAWELWELVKDNTGSEDSGKGRANKRGFEEAWGWNERGDEKRMRSEEKERNWGWDIVPGTSQEQPTTDAESICVEEEEEPREQETIGTMLRQLGINPETLGWDEAEGTFVGE